MGRGLPGKGRSGFVRRERRARRKQPKEEVGEEEDEKERATRLARALLGAALEPPDDVEEEDMAVEKEDQRSLSVGIIGDSDTGKSSLTNFMVGT